MGFGLTERYRQDSVQSHGGISVELFRRAECAACPLNTAHSRNPKMEPSGSDRPDVYMLGASPTKDDDDANKHFAGDYGRVLRSRIPSKWQDRLRWNNVIRDWVAKEPQVPEIESCRPSIERDIARTKPLAIFGFGPTPLRWALQEARINQWNGRRAPIMVGDYPVWFFPMLAPLSVMQSRRHNYRPGGSGQWAYGSQEEFSFTLDLKRAFKAVSAGLPQPVVHTPDEARKGIVVVDGSKGEEDLEHILYLLRQMEGYNGDIGLDYETDGLRPYRDEAHILTASASTKDITIAFAMDHREAGWNGRQRKLLDEAWSSFLERTPGRKIAHNLAFEMEWTAEFYGRKRLYDGDWQDTQAQAYILDERQDQPLSLDFLVLQYFGMHLKEMSNLDRKHMADEPLARILPYNGLDSKYCRLLYREQQKRLETEGLWKQYAHHLDRIPATVLTQRKGIPIDQSVIKPIGERYRDLRNAAEDRILDSREAHDFKSQFGEQFNVGSTPHVVKMFAKVIGIPLGAKKDGRGNVELGKTDATEAALSEIDHPIAGDVVAWREANKVYSTYCKPMMTGSPHLYSDGCIHPVLSTMKVRTWRTASQEPNSQNYPKYTDGSEVRSAIRREGHKVCAFDYGSIQARIVAMESLDKKLTKHFWDRYDIHSDWLRRWLKRHPKWCPPAELEDPKKRAARRHKVKNKFVFPSFFGAKAKSISIGLEAPVEKVEALQNEFWEEFPEIFGWQERIIEEYYEKGYVTGHSGFHRRAPIETNQLINAPIQAAESKIVLSAMSALSKLELWAVQPNMEIHDDLSFIWPIADIDRNSRIVLREMLKVRYDWINVPLAVEMSIGDDWNSLEKVAEFESDTWNGEFSLKQCKQKG